MSDSYYLDVTLELCNGQSYDVTPEYFKKNVMHSMKQVFGEIAASINVDILKYDSRIRRAILRVPADYYTRLHSALTLCGNYEGPEGKDIVIFATSEDHKIPSTVSLPEPEPNPGLILPNGDINWNCPCLGGMATGPCGVEFREAFSCFHYSNAEPKGTDCYEKFKVMQECMEKYPTLYNKDLGDDDEIAEALGKSEESTAKTKMDEKSTGKNK